MNRRRRRPDSGVSGALVIDKPAGPTSHDIVDRVRRALGTRKVGHAGTLDPDATGVLVLGVGRGTKLLQFVTGADKRYVGEVVFGVTTSTLDAAGDVVERFDMTLDPVDVEAAVASFVGHIEQVPPMVSAIRIDGKRLHELAREGVEVDRPPRPVTIHDLAVAATADPLVFEATVHCSSGTYIRTLAADLGTALGGGAHLRNLRRTAVGALALDRAIPLDDLDERGADALHPTDLLLAHLPRLPVDDEIARRVRSGQSLGPAAGSGRFVVEDPTGEALAVYESRDGEMRAVKVLVG